MPPKLEYFLICTDAVQNEQGGLNIQSFLPSSQLLVEGPGHVPILSIVLIWSGLTGISRFRPTCRVTSPTGEPRNSPSRPWLDRPVTQDSHIYKLTIQNLPLNQGKYIFDVRVEFDKDYIANYSREVSVSYFETNSENWGR